MNTAKETMTAVRLLAFTAPGSVIATTTMFGTEAGKKNTIASPTTSTTRVTKMDSLSSKNLQLSATISVATLIAPTLSTLKKIACLKMRKMTVNGKLPPYTRRTAMMLHASMTRLPKAGMRQ